MARKGSPGNSNRTTPKIMVRWDKL